jgi:NADP-dependent 3-hydroxy acid dehydrogenase YdfG
MDNGERTAVIVGASSGIGDALARELHKAGWHLGLLARRIDNLNALAADLGTRVSVAYCDVSKSDCRDNFNAMVDVWTERIWSSSVLVADTLVPLIRTAKMKKWSR